MPGRADSCGLWDIGHGSFAEKLWAELAEVGLPGPASFRRRTEGLGLDRGRSAVLLFEETGRAALAAAGRHRDGRRRGEAPRGDRRPTRRWQTAWLGRRSPRATRSTRRLAHRSSPLHRRTPHVARPAARDRRDRRRRRGARRSRRTPSKLRLPQPCNDPSRRIFEVAFDADDPRPAWLRGRRCDVALGADGPGSAVPSPVARRSCWASAIS